MAKLEANQKSKIKVHFEGKDHEFECESHTNILEAALDKGIDLPYSCMAGVCNTCQASLISGEVEMEYCDALSEDEVKQGEILTCQAKPRTTSVEIKFKS